MRELRGRADNPYHLSVGSIVARDGLIALVYKKKTQYTLPTETIYKEESVEAALMRGLEEELGIKVRVGEYIGSLISEFEREGEKIEKTSLYFMCEYTGDGEMSVQEDELEDEVQWVQPEDALRMLQENNRRNEFQIVDRYMKRL